MLMVFTRTCMVRVDIRARKHSEVYLASDMHGRHESSFLASFLDLLAFGTAFLIYRVRHIGMNRSAEG